MGLSQNHLFTLTPIPSLSTQKITEALRHSPGLVLGSQSEPVWTSVSEKLSLPGKKITPQYQSLRGKERAEWLVVEPELKSANEIKPPNEHSPQSPTSLFRPGWSGDGDPSCPVSLWELHGCWPCCPSEATPPEHPVPQSQSHLLRPRLGGLLRRHQIRHSI